MLRLMFVTFTLATIMACSGVKNYSPNYKTKWMESEYSETPIVTLSFNIQYLDNERLVEIFYNPNELKYYGTITKGNISTRKFSVNPDVDRIIVYPREGVTGTFDPILYFYDILGNPSTYKNSIYRVVVRDMKNDEKDFPDPVRVELNVDGE